MCKRAFSGHRKERKQATEKERYVSFFLTMNFQYIAEKLSNVRRAVIVLFRVCNIFMAHMKSDDHLFKHTHTHTQDSAETPILLNYPACK